MLTSSEIFKLVYTLWRKPSIPHCCPIDQYEVLLIREFPASTLWTECQTAWREGLEIFAMKHMLASRGLNF